MIDKKVHTPVMLEESIKYLDIAPDSFYIDCTLGEGGHSFEIFKQLSESGMLLSIDQDEEAIGFVRNYYEEASDARWKIRHGSFSNLKKVVSEFNVEPSGILMDIGISSRHLDIIDRGFSFQREDDLLDMRMNVQSNVTALDLLKVLPENELARMFQMYGEEKFARGIARQIKRNIEHIQTVKDLTEIINRAVPAYRKFSSKNPARRVFQALRIAVNDELNSLKQGLEQGFEILKPSGRIVVITFHSLEDRIVKEFIKSKEDESVAKNITPKPLGPTEAEIERNPRSRSAKLRTIQKLLRY